MKMEEYKGNNCGSIVPNIIYLFPVELPLKYDDSGPYHKILIKEHAGDNEPFGRTLSILNIPPYATENSLKNAFSPAGTVESVKLHEEEDHGFKSGLIVFTKTSGLLKALQLDQLQHLSTPEHPLPIGFKKYRIGYNKSIIDPLKLQKEVDIFMAEFDKREAAEKRGKKHQADDEEGWTVVTKKGRNPGLSRKESVENKLAEKLRKDEKRKNIQNFYTFQIRESKRDHIVQLREKFEEDKKKIEAFKKSRKFKPF